MAMKGLISPWLVGLIIGRDVMLLGGGFVYRWWTKPAGVPFFNTTFGASFEVKPTMISKVKDACQHLRRCRPLFAFNEGAVLCCCVYKQVNTVAQLGLCAYVVSNAVCDLPPAYMIPYLEYTTGLLTLSSGMQYIAMFASAKSKGYVEIK